MRRLVLALFTLLSIAACAEPRSPEVKDVWAYASLGGAKQAAVFMTIRSPTADRLIGASTSAAARTDLMTMEHNRGAMGMSYVKAIELPAEKRIRLDPAGLHVWLADLHKPLVAGQTLPLRLSFEKAGDIQVEVSVIGPAARPKPDMAM